MSDILNQQLNPLIEEKAKIQRALALVKAKIATANATIMSVNNGISTLNNINVGTSTKVTSITGENPKAQITILNNLKTKLASEIKGHNTKVSNLERSLNIVKQKITIATNNHNKLSASNKARLTSGGLNGGTSVGIPKPTTIFGSARIR